MAIKAKTIQYKVEFPPSSHPDVAGYRMYYCPKGQVLTEASPFIDLGNRTSFQVPGEFEELKGLTGEYRVAGRAYDAAGNFGPSGEEVIVPLDFQPPDAPGAFMFIVED
jgi:hypothetical protein